MTDCRLYLSFINFEAMSLSLELKSRILMYRIDSYPEQGKDIYTNPDYNIKWSYPKHYKEM
jgi:hypothetical protein